MILDHCSRAMVTEDEVNTSSDFTNCEAVDDTLILDDFILLNVNTPLQLGGRRENINYPPGLTKQGFTGCIKNFWHNGLVRTSITFQTLLRVLQG